MMASSLTLRRVSEFQQFLRDRGVIVSGQRKSELAELCEIAKDIHLDFDPDGLFEDRQEIILDKLTDGVRPMFTIIGLLKITLLLL